MIASAQIVSNSVLASDKIVLSAWRGKVLAFIDICKHIVTKRFLTHIYYVIICRKKKPLYHRTFLNFCFFKSLFLYKFLIFLVSAKYGTLPKISDSNKYQFGLINL